jgi:hypothetical protein
MIGAIGQRMCVTMQRTIIVLVVLIISFTAVAPSYAQEAPRGDVTAADVNESIRQGIAYLKKVQQADGSWTEYEGQPGGMTSLCTLSLLNCGLDKSDPAVSKALKYLEALPNPKAVYAASLRIMVFVAADPVAYKVQIDGMGGWLAGSQVADGETKGGWSYTDRPGRSDNSNTQFAMLALHEAERAGVKVPDHVWQKALNYWTSAGMQKADGSWGYELGHPSTGSMTCAGIASVIIAQDRLRTGDASLVGGQIQCCLPQNDTGEVDRAIQWLADHFSVTINPNTLGLKSVGRSHPWLLYYLYGVERVGRMSGRRHFVGHVKDPVTKQMVAAPHDWYREGAAELIRLQKISLNGSWRGIGLEGDPTIGTSLALLFLSKGKRPVVIAKARHSTGVLGDSNGWDQHRRAIQHLTSRIERQWRRDLTWQTVDLAGSSVADLLEAPVLFISGTSRLNLTEAEEQALKQYVEQGGFLFVEVCSGQGCDAEGFDRDFRKLVRKMFPESELRKLPPDHAVWFAQEKVNPEHLPKDPDFWLWGLDACCRTSIVYCPRSLSCYWELSQPYREANYPPAVRDEVEACVRIGGNVVAYATNRELKEKLDRPQITVSQDGQKPERGALVLPKLTHGGGSDDAPNALQNLLTVMEKELEVRVDFQRRLLAPEDKKLYDNPLLFTHGRRSFNWTPAQRRALKEYLDRGGFLFADAICASGPFADSLRTELRAMYPDARWTRIPPSHAMFTDEYGGFNLKTVTLRDPQIRDTDDPLSAKLVKTTPLLEGLEVDGRIVVILSPYDISCALEKGTSMECKGYTPADAAKIGANVLLFALQQE